MHTYIQTLVLYDVTHLIFVYVFVRMLSIAAAVVVVLPVRHTVIYIHITSWLRMLLPPSSLALAPLSQAGCLPQPRKEKMSCHLNSAVISPRGN